MLALYLLPDLKVYSLVIIRHKYDYMENLNVPSMNTRCCFVTVSLSKSKSVTSPYLIISCCSVINTSYRFVYTPFK